MAVHLPGPGASLAQVPGQDWRALQHANAMRRLLLLGAAPSRTGAAPDLEGVQAAPPADGAASGAAGTGRAGGCLSGQPAAQAADEAVANSELALLQRHVWQRLSAAPQQLLQAAAGGAQEETPEAAMLAWARDNSSLMHPDLLCLLQQGACSHLWRYMPAILLICWEITSGSSFTRASAVCSQLEAFLEQLVVAVWRRQRLEPCDLRDT